MQIKKAVPLPLIAEWKTHTHFFVCLILDGSAVNTAVQFFI